MKEQFICALLSAKAKTAHEAQRIAKKYVNCPHIYFLGTKDSQFFAIFFLPASQRWWIKYTETNPCDTFGFETAQVKFIDAVNYPLTPTMRFPSSPQKLSPCGSNCGTCPMYERCTGCPATRFYKPT